MNACRDYSAYVALHDGRENAADASVTGLFAMASRHLQRARLRHEFRQLVHLDDRILKDAGHSRETPEWRHAHKAFLRRGHSLEPVHVTMPAWPCRSVADIAVLTRGSPASSRSGSTNPPGAAVPH
jgi:hypothetical protein